MFRYFNIITIDSFFGAFFCFLPGFLSPTMIVGDGGRFWTIGSKSIFPLLMDRV